MADQTAIEAGRPRLDGVDAARALAIIGMFMVHFGPKGETDLLGRFYALPHGRASILFVMVAGIGITLLASRGDPLRARLRLLAFALFLLPLGLALEVLKHPVAVILHHYAAFFLLGIAAIGLKTRTLAILALVVTIVGPLLFYGGMMGAPRVFDRTSVDLTDSPLAIAAALLFTGPYPLIVWAAPLLWGMWLGRQDLSDRRFHLALMMAGVAIAAVAHTSSELMFGWLGEPGRNPDWRFVFADTAHSEMLPWVISAIGAGCFALGGMLALASAFPRVVAPLADLGRLALTVYVAHVLVLTVAGPLVRQREVLPAIVAVAVFATIATAFAMTWSRTIGRGPIERIMHLSWQALEALWPGAATTARSWRRSDG